VTKKNGTMIPTCGDEMRKVKTKWEEEKEKNQFQFPDCNPNMIAVVLKDQLLHSNFLERKKMTK
jgi:NADH pyrophosphatase NudC (nudix superfamily)